MANTAPKPKANSAPKPKAVSAPKPKADSSAKPKAVSAPKAKKGSDSKKKKKSDDKDKSKTTLESRLSKTNSGKIMHAFKPVRMFLTLVGLAPFTAKQEKDGSHVLNFGISLATLLFIILYILSSICLLTITAGCLIFLLGFFPYKELTIPFYDDDIETPGNYVIKQRNWLKYILKRNLVLFLIIWGCLVIAWATATVNFANRAGYVQYVNFWCRACDKMEMNVAGGATGYFAADHLITIILNGLIFVGFFAPIIHKTINLIPDLTDLITTVMLAPVRKVDELISANLSWSSPPNAVIRQDMSSSYYYMYKVPGLYLCVYSLNSFRGAILQFVFFNRLLVKACQIWNERLRNALAENTTVEKATQREDQKKEQQDDKKVDKNTTVRLDLRNVLRDHLRIVNLFKMTDVMFSWTLLTYYAFQIMITTLLAYSLFSLRYETSVYDHRIIEYLESDREKAAAISRSQLNSKREDYEWITAVQRGLALVAFGLLLSVLVILTTKTSARAYEEGMGGFQILRRNFYLGNCDTKDERNFVHDLVVSFAPNNPLIVTAEGYFKMRRSLLPALMGSVAGYFVACYTLKPDQGNFWDGTDDIK